MAAKHNGNGQNGNAFGIKIGEKAGGYVDAVGQKYMLSPEPDVVKDAFFDLVGYVEEGEARKYVMKHLGYINPRLVVVLACNLQRELRYNEVILLGGPDGDKEFTCELSVDQVLKDDHSLSDDDLATLSLEEKLAKLTSVQQRSCRFMPGWSLSFTGINVVVHLLNVMTNDKYKKDDLGRALLEVKEEQIFILGNHFVVRDTHGNPNTADVKGKPYHLWPDGKVADGHGQWKIFEKNLLEMGADFQIVAQTVTTRSLLDQLREPLLQKQEERQQSRIGVARGLAARLMGKKPTELAQARPLH